MDNLVTQIMSEEYLLNRLVYINSANHAYSEIMLDTHMAMFGNNNVGKTASLAGMKLLLFPEVDFHRCENKFKFKGKEGVYSMEESYDFYFPDARSFIILEVRNPEGVFCMVLYKTNNYGYGRFFIPVPYEQVRELFWDEEGEQFADGMGISSVSQFAKEHVGQQVTDSKEIASLMFSSYRDIPGRKRFCVLPLKDDKRESIDAFRNIYQLAFETGSLKSKTLPDAIAALLEMGRSRDQERLDANLTELTEQHSQLYAKGEWLQKLSNSKPVYDAADDKYKAANAALIEYSGMYHACRLALNLAKKNHAPESERIQAEHTKATGLLSSTQRDLTAVNKQFNKNRGAGVQLSRHLKKKEGELAKAKALRATYGDMEVSEILEILQEDLATQKSKLKNLREEGGIAVLLEENLEGKKLQADKKNRLEELISKDGLMVLHQLDDQAANILHTINKSFARVAAELSEADKSTILDFTRLFQEDSGGYLTLLGRSFDGLRVNRFDSEKAVLECKDDLNKTIAKLEDLESEIRAHSKARSKEDIDALIIDAEKNIAGFCSDIQSIGGIGTLESDVAATREELSSNEEEKEKLSEKNIELDRKHSEANGCLTKLDGQLSDIREKQSEFEVIKHNLNTAKQVVTPVSMEVEPLSPEESNASYSYSITERASEFNRLLSSFKDSFNALLRDLPHPDVDSHRELPQLSDYDESIRVYGSAFETLEYDVIQQKNAVRSHNQLFNNQLSEITESSSLLRNFVSDINKELNDKHVSNLSEINLHLELNPAFLTLISVLDAHDIQGEVLLEPQLYESLSKFVEKFFNKKSRRLKMADIIEQMSYHYRLEATGEVVTKSQSGGTTSVITAFVLSVLLKRITPPYVQLQMPIIVDEISTLDTVNTDSTIKQITEHGFSIFCATPSFSAFVSQKVGSWVMIDRSMIRQPMVQSCHLNILPSHVESYGEQA